MLRIPLLFLALPVFSCLGSAQSQIGSTSVDDARSIRRYIVSLRGGVHYDLPLAERERGLPLAERAAMHELDVDRRTRECAVAVATLQPTLNRLGAQLLFEVPMFHACVLDCPTRTVGELRASPLVTGVWADSIAPSLSRTTPPLSDPRPTGVEHHRARMAHEKGYTGAGSSTWAPVAAVLDAWLLGNFGSSTRHHAALHVGGIATQPTRVLADLDWNSPPTALPSRPLPPPTAAGYGNLYHGVGIAGAMAAGKTSGTGVFAFAPGHAPGAGLVSVNITSLLPAQTVPTCAGLPLDPAGYWAYQSQVILALNKVAAQRFTYTGTSVPSRPITIANLSYGGPTNPTHIVNDVMRQLSNDFEILVVTAAGNSGGTIYESYYNVNGLAVASAEFWRTGSGSTWARRLSPFSTTGPQRPNGTCSGSTPCWCLAGGDANSSWDHPNSSFGRTFPDVAAIGDDQVVLLQDTEAVSDMQSGTSVAAPHVSGAALLFSCGLDGQTPAVIPTALETRAVLLATTENETNLVSVGVGNGDNAMGAGFLRTDRVTYARSASELGFGTTNAVTAVGATHRLTQFTVVAGHRYAVSLAWFADGSSVGITAPNWLNADLVLTLPNGGQVTGAEAFGNRTWERLEFTAPIDGTVLVDAIVLRTSTANPTQFTGAFAHCCVDDPGAPPSSVTSTPTTAPISTCGVMQPSPSSLVATTTANYNASLSSPTYTTRYDVNLADLDARASQPENPDGRWLALRLDGAGFSYNGFGTCSWSGVNAAGGIMSATRVQLRTDSPIERVVPCALLSGSATWSSPPNSPTNRWNGFLRIPAGVGTATAEFQAVVSANPPSSAQIRWFAAQLPPDVIVGYRRATNNQQTQCPVGLSWLTGSGMYCRSSDAVGAAWIGVTAGLWYNIEVFGSGALVQGSPTMSVVAPPSLTTGAIEFLLGGNEQQNAGTLDVAFLVVDLVPGETAVIQSLDPPVNGTCLSLFKSSSILLTFAGAFSSNSGTAMQNIAVAPAGHIRLPVAADPLFLGSPLVFQALTSGVSGGYLQLRPTNLATVRFGL